VPPPDSLDQITSVKGPSSTLAAHLGRDEDGMEVVGERLRAFIYAKMDEGS
jgi:hypothetical protein